MDLFALLAIVLFQPPDEIVIPAVGRPTRDFYGAAGERVALTSSIDRRRVTPSEWLVYTLRIEGLLNADAVERPKLENLPGFRDSFQIEHLPEVKETDPRRRTFAYRLRPRDPTVSAIPPFAFRYYDPRDENNDTAFRLTLAESMPIEVVDSKPLSNKRSVNSVYAHWRQEPSFFDYNLALSAVRVCVPFVGIAFVLRHLSRSGRQSYSTAALRAAEALRKIENWPAREKAIEARRLMLRYVEESFSFDAKQRDGTELISEIADRFPIETLEPIRAYLADCEAIRYGGKERIDNWADRFETIAATVEQTNSEL